MNNLTPNTPTSDITIIGSGMTGMAAALFAVNRGISTTLIGRHSAMNFASGLMDLMGIHPAGREWDDPWKAINRIRKDLPDHPLAKVDNRDIETAIEELLAFLKDQALPYHRAARKNVNVVTSVGTVKKTYTVPETMWNGVAALEKKSPALIVDLDGMKLFSARQIASSLKQRWPGLRARTIVFPGTETLEELHPEHVARALDLSANRVKLADRIKPFIKDAACIGFPALLGMYRSLEAVKELEQLLERPVFEIPTPPVSVPGIRLQETFVSGLGKNPLFRTLSTMVTHVETNSGFAITAGKSNAPATIRSKAVLLATGRFLGKGLTASRQGIRESLMDLPVEQPETREEWHRDDLFSPQGHPVNKAGIKTDESFRPLGRPSDKPVKNLYVAGSILAGSDWMRMKCGSGVAIATAFAAVKAIEKANK
ncbi:MAG: anaerobic glycerol-3-phosphate dehydrogenase subunit B [Desulfobacteraceae bacterium]|nr:anaerobic glycerol-3-phosphate dehydrogenase subunit B [Desulfobacteraceae bacterium]